MPASDFASHDPDFSPAQEAQCHRIVDGLRQINSKIVRLGGPLEELTAAAERVEALLASLDAVSRVRALPSYRFEFDLDDPNAVIPFNPATGIFNPIAPTLRMTVEGAKLIVRCAFPNAYESAPDTVHGGMVAAVYDQVLAYAVMLAGKTGPTVWIKVTYLKPTPINEPLVFEGAVESVDGRKFSVKACCYHGDIKVSEAEALMLGSYDVSRVGSSPE